MRQLTAKILLLGASTLLSVVAAEIVLRLVSRKYEYAAESHHRVDSLRIWSRVPHSSYLRRHPDTGVSHMVIHNNLGMRQHRNIDPRKPAGETRIGLFGDSWTENLRVAAPCSFSEVLDYLLNLHDPQFSVLNFGVDGYGPDQSLLFYRDSEVSAQLDVVAYVFFHNDLRNLYENDLFELTPAGELRRKLPEIAWYVPLVSRLHITYLAIDFRNRLAQWAGYRDQSRQQAIPLRNRRLSAEMERKQRSRFRDEVGLGVQQSVTEGIPTAESEKYLKLFRALLASWRSEVETAGGSFHIVFLPSEPAGLGSELFDDYSVIDLGQEDARYPFPDAGWRFDKDGHWNEWGNRQAALILYHYFLRRFGLQPLSGAELARELCDYYRSFEGRWVPSECLDYPQLSRQKAQRIRERYTSLETLCLAPGQDPTC